MIDASQITPWLWCGQEPANAEALRELRDRIGLTGVLNVQTRTDMRAGWFDLPAREIAHVALGLVLRWVPIVDFDDDSLERELPRAVAALDELRHAAPNAVVFIHCTVGVQRSPTVVAAYLAWRLGYEIEDAAARVRAARPIAAPRVGVIRACRRPPA
jgi:protein-tyrosine phosphatase